MFTESIHPVDVHPQPVSNAQVYDPNRGNGQRDITIIPGDEHIFRAPYCGQHRIIVINESSFNISADLGWDEGVPILFVGKEGGPTLFHGLENKDQTVTITDSFLRKHRL